MLYPSPSLPSLLPLQTSDFQSPSLRNQRQAPSRIVSTLFFRHTKVRNKAQNSSVISENVSQIFNGASKLMQSSALRIT
jgi:hypothetical protein